MRTMRCDARHEIIHLFMEDLDTQHLALHIFFCDSFKTLIQVPKNRLHYLCEIFKIKKFSSHLISKKSIRFCGHFFSRWFLICIDASIYGEIKKTLR